MQTTNPTEENIVFLDFDGVLNHVGCNEETDFTDDAINILNQLYESHNIKIVLSTTWKDAYLFSDLIQLLQEKGIQAPVIDKTPMDTYHGQGIKAFIKLHHIKHYVILDDAPFQDSELIKHHVQTIYFNENGGLRPHHKAQIETILNSTRKETQS